MAEMFEADSCRRCTYVIEDNLFTLLLGGGERELVVLTSIDVAAQVATLIAAAMREIQRAGRTVDVPRIPETIVSCTAASAEDGGGGVILALSGSMTGPLLGRMSPSMAKALAALLQGSAEPPPSRSAS